MRCFRALRSPADRVDRSAVRSVGANRAIARCKVASSLPAAGAGAVAAGGAAAGAGGAPLQPARMVTSDDDTALLMMRICLMYP